MKCLGCNGEIGMLIDEDYKPNPFDTLGVCTKCTGTLLRNETEVLAKEFCHCEKVNPQQTLFYFRPNGRHGYLHTVCGQITQTG